MRTYAIWLFWKKGWFNNVLQRFYSLQQHETDWESSDSVTGCICCSSNASSADRNTQISRNSKEVEEPHKVFHEAHWELKIAVSRQKGGKHLQQLRLVSLITRSLGCQCLTSVTFSLKFISSIPMVASSYKNNTEYPKVEPLQRVTSCQKVEWWCMSFT